MKSIYSFPEMKQSPSVSFKERITLVVGSVVTQELSEIVFLLRATNGRTYMVPCVRRLTAGRSVSDSPTHLDDTLQVTLFGVELFTDEVQLVPYLLLARGRIILTLPAPSGGQVFTPHAHIELAVKT
jgi:hypothetical protein